MQLRHIRPGSVDWNDAVTEDQDQQYARLGPEEIKKLRTLLVTDRASMAATEARKREAGN